MMRFVGTVAAGLTLLMLPAASMPAAARGQAPAQGTGRGIQANLEHPVLPIGSPLPSFSLPGVDGKTHTAAQYSGTRLLAIVFESNHCPVSQLYESRIEKLYEDYRRKGVTLV